MLRMQDSYPKIPTALAQYLKSEQQKLRAGENCSNHHEAAAGIDGGNQTKDGNSERTCAAPSGVSQESGTLSSCTRLSRSPPEAAAAARRGGRAGDGRAEAEAEGRDGLLGGARKGRAFDGGEGEWRWPWRRRAAKEVEDDIFPPFLSSRGFCSLEAVFF